MKIKMLVLTLLGVFSTSMYCKDEAMISFKSQISPLSSSLQEVMHRTTWNPGCPVALSDLVEVYLSYWGFDAKPHEGLLIVNQAVAQELVTLFKVLYEAKFAIEKMRPIEEFGGDDQASMEANNTSAFNCRLVTGQAHIFSQHSYGRAIDINPRINPYVKGDLVLPHGSKMYVDRNQAHPGKIQPGHLIYTLFTEHGWDWGGHWRDVQDYQHFEKRMNHEKRNPEGY